MYVYFSMTENQFRALVQQYGSPDETISCIRRRNIALFAESVIMVFFSVIYLHLGYFYLSIFAAQIID